MNIVIFFIYHYSFALLEKQAMYLRFVVETSIAQVTELRYKHYFIAPIYKTAIRPWGAVSRIKGINRKHILILYEGKGVVAINNGEIIGKVHNSMYQQIKKSGVASPVQVLMDVGVLSSADLERWRFGKVDYLERVCKVNLSKLSFIMKEVRAYARKNDLKPSFTLYKQWGCKGKTPTIKLRFSKHGVESVEKNYATHYISSKHFAEKKPPAEAECEE